MTEFIVVFFIAFILSFLLVPLVKKAARKSGAINQPDDKKRVSTKSVYSLGGLALPLSFLIAVIFSLLVFKRAPGDLFGTLKAFIGFLTGGLVIVSIGVLNDIKPVQGLLRLGFYVLGALCAVTSGIMIFKTNIPFLPASWIETFPLTGYIVTILWIVLMIYIVKIIGSMEQYSSGISVLIFLFTFLLGLIMNNTGVQILSVAILGSVAGMYLFNSRSEIELGETGGVFLGYTLAVVSISGSIKAAVGISTIIPLVLVSIPVAEFVIHFVKKLFKVKNNVLPVWGLLHFRLHHKNYDDKQIFFLFFIIFSIAGFTSIIYMEKGLLSGALFGVAAIVTVYVGILSKRRLEGSQGIFEKIRNKNK